MRAVGHSLRSFFNSFFLERHHELRVVDDRPSFLIPLEGSELVVPLKRHSVLGRHEYTGEFFLRIDSALERISFERVLELLLEGSELKSRVFESVENMERALTSRTFFSTPLDFITAEQSLFAGHDLHPAPKSRQGFSLIDSALYSPESGANFPLRWFLLDNEFVFRKSAAGFFDTDWPLSVLREELPEVRVPAGFTPVPMHPWQARFILNHSWVKSLKSQGKLIEVQETGADWTPTSSVRTLYRKDSRYQLKFSLNVKLTNSVRHMLAHELERGLQLHEVLSSPAGKEFLEANPSFSVLSEPVYLGIKGPDGLPLTESFVMGRENYQRRDEDTESVLAVLTQNLPERAGNLLADEVAHSGLSSREWFDHFLKVAVRPLLLAQADFGILLGAHQQNLVIGFKNHLPVRATFRDCHGTGYSELGGKIFVDVLRENLLPKDLGNYLFSYYLVINSVFSVISALGPEEELIRSFREFLRELRGSVRDPGCLDYLLESEFLFHKGNFGCSLRALNENTTEDPLSIYVRIKNPLRVKESP